MDRLLPDGNFFDHRSVIGAVIRKESIVYYFAIAATVAMIAVSADGCRSSSSIYPQARVVVEPVKTDFGFIGTWRAVPTQNSPNIDINEDFSISMSADGVYKLECKALVDFAITLRATELDKDSGYAIVDVDIVADEKQILQVPYVSKTERRRTVRLVD